MADDDGYRQRLLDVALIDLKTRTDEIRERTGQEHRAYLAYFSSFVTIVVAAVAANRFGLLASIREVVPTIFIGVAILALWLPLNEMNEQFRIRIAAVYVERRLVPQILALLEQDIGRAALLSWEPFQYRLLAQARISQWFGGLLLLFRGLISYAPAIAAFVVAMITGAYAVPAQPWNVLLTLLAAVIALVPLVCAVYIGASKKLSLDVAHRTPAPGST